MSEEQEYSSLFEKAVTLQKSGAIESAKRIYGELLRKYPQRSAIWCNLAMIHKNEQNYDLALECLNRAMLLTPEQSAILGNLVDLYMRIGDYHEAIPIAKKLIALEPTHHEHYLKLAASYFALKRFDQAEETIQNSLDKMPDQPELLTALGKIWMQQGRDEEAKKILVSAILHDPNQVQAHMTLAVLLLRSGALREGFATYEWRLQSPALRAFSKRFAPIFKLPRFDLTDKREGTKLLVYGESSLWGQISMSRYIALLKERNKTMEIHFFGDPRLKNLMRIQPYIDKAYGWDEVPDGCDYRISAMSLPYLFATNVSTVPLLSLHLDRQETKERLERNRYHIGLVWAGEYGARRDLELMDYAPLMLHDRLRLYALEPSEAIEEVRYNGLEEEDISLRHLYANDIYKTALFIEQLDLIITTDSYIADIAAGIGKPVWVLSDEKTHWRWHGDGDKTLWYPSVRLFKERGAELKQTLWNAIERKFSIQLKRRRACEAV